MDHGPRVDESGVVAKSKAQRLVLLYYGINGYTEPW